MPGSIGPLEIGIVLVIALIVFGPKRLPDLGKGLGRGMREFKESVSGKEIPNGDDVPAIGAVRTESASSASHEISSPDLQEARSTDR